MTHSAQYSQIQVRLFWLIIPEIIQELSEELQVDWTLV